MNPNTFDDLMTWNASGAPGDSNTARPAQQAAVDGCVYPVATSVNYYECASLRRLPEVA